jgi:hypothetical protein
VAHMRNGKGLGRWQLAHADPVARDAVEHWMKPILRMIGMILWVLLRYHVASFAFHQQDINGYHVIIRDCDLRRMVKVTGSGCRHIP